MPAAYDLGLTLLSLAIAIGVTGAAFLWVARADVGLTGILVAGTMMGLGVAAMHYTGMAALRIPGDLVYDPALVALSVAIAVIAATAALWLSLRQHTVGQKLVAACIMGIAVAGHALHRHGGGTVHRGGRRRATPRMRERARRSNKTSRFTWPARRSSSCSWQCWHRPWTSSGSAGPPGERSAVPRRDPGRARRALDQRCRRPDARRSAGLERDHRADARGVSGLRLGRRGASGRCAGLAEAWNETVRARRTFIHEHRVRSQDGTLAPLRDPGHPGSRWRGVIREWVGVHTDITEQREAEADLRESNEEIQRYAYIVSHDLRAPLVNVMGFTSELEATRAEMRAALRWASAGSADRHATSARRSASSRRR